MWDHRELAAPSLTPRVSLQYAGCQILYNGLLSFSLEVGFWFCALGRKLLCYGIKKEVFIAAEEAKTHINTIKVH